MHTLSFVFPWSTFPSQLIRKVLQSIIIVSHGRMGWPMCEVFAIPVLEGRPKERESAFILGLQPASSLAQRNPDGSM